MYLGFRIDEKLTWFDQINIISLHIYLSSDPATASQFVLMLTEHDNTI